MNKPLNKNQKEILRTYLTYSMNQDSVVKRQTENQIIVSAIWLISKLVESDDPHATLMETLTGISLKKPAAFDPKKTAKEYDEYQDIVKSVEEDTTCLVK